MAPDVLLVLLRDDLDEVLERLRETERSLIPGASTSLMRGGLLERVGVREGAMVAECLGARGVKEAAGLSSKSML